LSIPSTPSCRHSFNNFCRDINHIETGFYLWTIKQIKTGVHLWTKNHFQPQ
jgi:hypothetical protein